MENQVTPKETVCTVEPAKRITTARKTVALQDLPAASARCQIMKETAGTKTVIMFPDTNKMTRTGVTLNDIVERVDQALTMRKIAEKDKITATEKDSQNKTGTTKNARNVTRHASSQTA